LTSTLFILKHEHASFIVQKLIRKGFTMCDRGENQTFVTKHIWHCLDSLRQNVLCQADDTPMPAARAHHVGDGELRKCRSWDKIAAWAKRPDQNACYRFNDYQEAANTLELFEFCPVYSPYRLVMEAYFEYHGHKGSYGRP
jgi:hypothetical protein